MLYKLIKITITPTDTIMAFVDILLETLAAIGEANALPNTMPATADQCAPLPFNIVINVKELINAIKKRESFTEPNENLGLRPPAINDERTIEPQPPPPTASIKPPLKPSKRMRLILPWAFLYLGLNAFDRMTPPNIKVYNDTTGLVYML